MQVKTEILRGADMLKLNKATYMDKLHACWIGKNIGGTLGAPYEGSRELRDVKGFVTKKGEPLPLKQGRASPFFVLFIRRLRVI
jgi:hypothetical protein